MRMLNGHVAVTWPGLDLAGHRGADAHEREAVPGSEAGLVYGRSVTTPSALVWQDDESLGLRAGERVIAVRVEAELHTEDGIEVQMIPTQRVEHVTRKGERVRLRTQLHPIAAVWRYGQWQAVGRRVVGTVEAPPPPSSMLHVEPQPEPYRRLRVSSVGPDACDLSPGSTVLVPADATSRMEWHDASGSYLSVVGDDVHGVVSEAAESHAGARGTNASTGAGSEPDGDSAAVSGAGTGILDGVAGGGTPLALGSEGVGRSQPPKLCVKSEIPERSRAGQEVCGG